MALARNPFAVFKRLSTIKNRLYSLFPGVIVSMIVATTAQFLADHYSTPVMLLALLLGMAVSFLGEEGRTVAGISFTGKTLLRVGVVLGVLATILFGLWVARFFGHGWRFGLLTAGAVAICGASAAMAISAILPKDDRSEQRLIFTVLGVTVLSTMAMVAYPVVVHVLDISETGGGVFLGGTIHDVAQVVGAGFSISEPTGDTATLVKLIRVALLAPVVLVASVVIRSFAQTPRDGSKPPLLPTFVVVFLVLATLNSLHLIPAQIATFLSEASRWLLLTAIAAVGMKTNLKHVLAVGGPAIALLFTETLFIASFVLIGITALP
jgi:uncharacterized integral membrane protein (TIGR00698 family)